MIKRRHDFCVGNSSLDRQGIDEMMAYEPLPPLLTEADVAFDMDLVLVDDIEDDVSDDSGSDSEGGSDVDEM